MNFNIDNKIIGDNCPVFIIAEMSANHNQNYEKAIQIIKEAKKAGVDAIKIQTYTPDTITIDCDNDYFKIKHGTIWDGMTLYDLYKEAYTPWEWQPKLKKVAEEEGLILFSSPFDKTAVDFLEEMDVQVYKIASFEINDIPLIDYIAKKNKPIILSTGIANLTDIEGAIGTIRGNNNDNIALLKCTSSYPAPIEDANLIMIKNLSETFNVITGLSDHTLGITAPIASVILGAKIIEKHFTLSRNDPGPDSKFSLEPDELRLMIKSVREAEKVVGEINYEISNKVVNNRKFSRSLFVVKDMKKGEVFNELNVKSIRPNDGLHTKYYNTILGKKVKCDIKKGTPLSWDLIDYLN